MSVSDAGPVVTARWLARFRWAVVFGAAATLAIARGGLDVAFPLSDRITERRIPLTGTLRSASIVRDDGMLAEILKN